MIAHYTKVALRNIAGYKIQTVISILGLAIGLVCFAFSTLWIRYELSYDQFHNGIDRIYMIQTSSRDNSYTPQEAYRLKNKYPEIEELASVEKIIQRDSLGQLIHILKVGRGFFQLFSTPFTEGNEEAFFDHPLNAAINEQSVNRLCGAGSAIGSRLKTDIKKAAFMYPDWRIAGGRMGEEYRVTNTLKQWAGPSDFRFDYILPELREDKSAIVFIKLAQGIDVKAFEQKLIAEETGITALYPFTDIHFSESIPFSPPGNLTFKQIQIFSLASFITILCFVFNYLSLFISRMRKNARQMALQRVMGASFFQLHLQLATEIALLFLLSGFAGLLLIEWIMPYFIGFANIQSENASYMGELILYLLAVIVVMQMLSAIPLCRVRKTSLAVVFRNGTVSNGNPNVLQNGLLCFQLAIGVLFLVCTSVFISQIQYLNKADLGYDKNRLCFVELSNNMKMYDFSSEIEALRSSPEIESIGSYFAGRICGSFENLYFGLSQQTGVQEPFFWPLRSVSPDYFTTCKIPFLQGAGHTDVDGPAFVINEAAAKALGIQDHATSKHLDILDMDIRSVPIIGVIKNTYEFISQEVKPLVYMVVNSQNRIVYRYKPDTRMVVEKKVKALLAKKVSDEMPEFVYMEEVVKNQNKAEENFLELLYILSFICIAGALFGVYAMVSLSCEQRRKEVAIRKINGATTLLLVDLFLKKYWIILVFASVIAFCVGTVIMQQWLEQFLFRVSIHFLLYFIIFVGVATVLSLIVILRIWKSVRLNPAQELKKE